MRDKPLDLRFPTRGQDPDDYTGNASYQPRVKVEKGDKTIDRNWSEADEVRRCDQYCIATGCPEIEACHIMPLSLNNRPSRLSNARVVLAYIVGPMMPAIHNHLTNTSKISSHGVSLSRTSNFRPLVSGDILLIRVKEEDLDKKRLMVQIQWLALRMAAISGAAEVVDDLDAEPPSNIQELPTYPKGFLEFQPLKVKSFTMFFCPGAGGCTPHNDGQFLIMPK